MVEQKLARKAEMLVAATYVGTALMLDRRITVPEQHLCWSIYAGAPMLEHLCRSTYLSWSSSYFGSAVMLKQ